jgi:hypothetical protein
MPTSCCREACVGLVVAPGTILTLPFNVIACVTLPISAPHLRNSASLPAPHPDLPSQLQNIFAAYIGFDTRILWKIHADSIAEHAAALSRASKSPLPTSSPFASALSSPKPSFQLSNKTLSPFAAALVSSTPPLSPTLALNFVATPGALAHHSPVAQSSAAPDVKYLSLAQRVDAALENMTHPNHAAMRLGGLHRETRILLEQICCQHLQSDFDSSHSCISSVRPLIVVYGCEGCGKRSLIRSACAAVEPPVPISEFNCESLSMASADSMQHSLELCFASAARSNCAVLITGVHDVLNTRKFSSAVTARFVSALITLLMERQLSNSMNRSPCVITCASPELLDPKLRAFARLELCVPSPSLDDRASIIATHIDKELHPAIHAAVASEFYTGGKFAGVLSLTCETMTGFRFGPHVVPQSHVAH